MKLAQTALFAALCYVSFTYLKIDLPGGTALHIGNAFCVLCALLLGGLYGGLAGAIGMTIADLTTSYAASAPKTFVLKLCIGLIVGLVAHKYAKISQSTDKKYVLKWVILSCIAGLGFNVIFDPIAGYFYKRYILQIGADLSSIAAKWGAASTFINAIVSTILVTIIYMALVPALKKAKLFQIVK